MEPKFKYAVDIVFLDLTFKHPNYFDITKILLGDNLLLGFLFLENLNIFCYNL